MDVSRHQLIFWLWLSLNLNDHYHWSILRSDCRSNILSNHQKGQLTVSDWFPRPDPGKVYNNGWSRTKGFMYLTPTAMLASHSKNPLLVLTHSLPQPLQQDAGHKKKNQFSQPDTLSSSAWTGMSIALLIFYSEIRWAGNRAILTLTYSRQPDVFTMSMYVHQLWVYQSINTHTHQTRDKSVHSDASDKFEEVRGSTNRDVYAQDRIHSTGINVQVKWFT